MGIVRSLIEKRISPSTQGVNWALYGLEGSAKTSTGKKITEEDAQTCTIVYSCLRVLSETIASLPIFVFERTGDDSRERAKDYFLYDVLHVNPNPEMVSMVFREIMMLHLGTWGNFYANIALNKSNEIAELWPLRPDRMEIERRNGQIIYVYTLPSGEKRFLPREEVLHIPGFGFDGVQGYSPIHMNREAIGLAMAAEEYGARFFANDARPGIILKHPGNLSTPAQNRLKDSWEERHVGLENKHRLAVLEEGMDISQIGFPPGDTQWIELRKMQLDEIARIYRIPPPLIGNLDRATFSNVEELTRHFAIHTIRPWLIRIESIMNFRLIPKRDMRTHYVEHNMDAMMRADTGARYSAYATGRQWGFLSANDIRKLENMEPIEDGGDLYLIPGNMNTSKAVAEGKIVQPSQAGAQPGEAGRPEKGNEKTGAAKQLKLVKHAEEEDGEEGDDLEVRKVTDAEMKDIRRRIRERQSLTTSFEPLFRTCFNRICNRETLQLEKAVKRQERSVGDDLRRVMEDLYNNANGKLPEFIRESYEPVLRAFASAIQAAAAEEIADPEAMEDLSEFIESYLQDFIDTHIRVSRGQLENLLDTTELEDQAEVLSTRINEWKEKRAEKIISDQIVRAGNAIAHQVFFFSLAVTSLVWVARGRNPCPYCRALSGTVINKTKSFLEPGDVITGERQDEISWFLEYLQEYRFGELLNWKRKSHPPVHPGCECTVAALRGKRKPQEEKDKAKVERSKKAHSGGDHAAQVLGEANEGLLASKLRNAVAWGIETNENTPFDVVTGKSRATALKEPKNLVELKTLTSQKNDKLTLGSSKAPGDALFDKREMAKKLNVPAHTVAIDARDIYISDKGKTYFDRYSGHKLYYREGLGNFHLRNMKKVTWKELQRILE